MHRVSTKEAAWTATGARRRRLEYAEANHKLSTPSLQQEIRLKKKYTTPIAANREICRIFVVVIELCGPLKQSTRVFLPYPYLRLEFIFLP